MPYAVFHYQLFDTIHDYAHVMILHPQLPVRALPSRTQSHAHGLDFRLSRLHQFQASGSTPGLFEIVSASLSSSDLIPKKKQKSFNPNARTANIFASRKPRT